MKKTIALLCSIALFFSVTGCGKGVEPGESEAQSMPVPSRIVASDSVVSAPLDKGGESAGSSGAASTAAKIFNYKAAANKNTGEYKVKASKYTYRKDNIEYNASYPQLEGSLQNLSKINGTLEKCALQTINSLGTSKKAERTTVKVTGDVTYEGKTFLSVGFNEYVGKSSKGKPEHGMRTVNINLKTGTLVGFKDMMIQSDAFFQALEQAAKQQADSASEKSFTAQAIRQGIDPNVIYFTDTSVGFGVMASNPERRLVRLTLNYMQAQPFMTGSEIWHNFL